MSQEQHDTKSMLFFAGVREFAAKGYKAATVRGICKRAGAANVNAVNYYFGGKEKMYRVVLDAMFGELGKQWDKVDASAPPDQTTRERLRQYMTVYCTLLYDENELARAFTAIFLSEMVRPSSFLEESLATSVAPQTERFIKLMLDLLGPDADEIMARRCFVSALGPLLYPAIVRPAAMHFFDAPVTDDITGFVDHAFRFALAGIQAIQNDLHTKESQP